MSEHPISSPCAPTLTTERLTLRAWNINDIDDLFAAASDPDVGPLCGWPAHKTRDDSQFAIEHIFNTSGCFAIEYEGKAVGCIDLKPCNASHELLSDEEASQARELGYWVAKEYWGLGIVPEAGERVLQYAFDELQLKTLWGMHDVGNRRSRRVLEKLGMHRVRIAPHVPQSLLGEGLFHDLVINCITREEWQADPHLRDRFEAPTEEHVLSLPFVQPEGVVKY